MQQIIPVLIAGGAGTRLWPASRGDKPKPFHKLGMERTLLQDTALRFQGPMFAAPIVICSIRHAELARAQLIAAGVEPMAVLAEPEGRNTAPAVIAAAVYGAEIGPQSVLMLVHADNLASDIPTLHAAVAGALPAVNAGHIVLFGIKPDGPRVEYGYIQAGLGDGATHAVTAFVEKPDIETARRFVADPAYSWNGGMFLFQAGGFLDEARRLAPEATLAVIAAVAEARREGGVVAMSDAFRTAPAIAVDYAILEKTDRARVVITDFGWSDAGTWSALWGSSPKDEAGNVLSGDVITAGADHCLAQTDGPTVVLAGVSDLVVVVENGVVLVASRSAADGAYK
jgi:mannose-1-phosphate guanylyltransferase/mannose-6-phosphate isomerase